MPHSRFGDEGITNMLSDVLTKSQGHKNIIGDTTYDELTLLAVVGLIVEQQSPYLTVVAPSTSIYTFDVEQIIINPNAKKHLW